MKQRSFNAYIEFYSELISIYNTEAA